MFVHFFIGHPKQRGEIRPVVNKCIIYIYKLINKTNKYIHV